MNDQPKEERCIYDRSSFSRLRSLSHYNDWFCHTCRWPTASKDHKISTCCLGHATQASRYPNMNLTCQYEQQWVILCPEAREAFPLAKIRGSWPSGSFLGHGHPRDYMFAEGDKRWHAFELLARFVSGGMPVADTRQHRKRLSSIETLAPEILNLILRALGEKFKVDIVAFGQTSSTLWAHMLHFVRHGLQANRPGKWAGLRICCTGDYLTDLPDGFSNVAQRALEMREDVDICEARILTCAATRTFKHAWYNVERGQRRKEAFEDVTEDSDDCDALKNHLAAICQPLPFDAFSADWILRDLHTKEYVLLCIDAGQRGISCFIMKHERVHWLSLEDVLFMRICWTYLEHGGSNTQGQWAGHAFDVILHARTEEGDGWVDITERVVQEAETLIEKKDSELAECLTRQRQLRNALVTGTVRGRNPFL